MSMMDLPKACCQANAMGLACTCDRYPAGYLANPQITPFQATKADPLSNMTDEQRMDVFSKYCRHCGSDNPDCQCWNDE